MGNNIDYDVYLIKYDRVLRSYVLKTSKRAILPEPFEIDDVMQECRIYLWKLLRDKYDSKIGNIDAFIICSIPLIVQNVFHRIISSHNSTGTGRSNRTRKAKLHQSTVPYIDNMEETASHQYLLEDFKIDLKIISTEMSKRLNLEYYQTYELIFEHGLSKRDAAKITNKSFSSIANHMKNHIIPTLIDVLLEFKYIKNNKR